MSTLVKPPLCPRCGSNHFEEATINLVPYGNIEVRAGVWRCTTCAMTFDGKTWRDAANEEWVMAESGT